MLVSILLYFLRFLLCRLEFIRDRIIERKWVRLLLGSDCLCISRCCYVRICGEVFRNILLIFRIEFIIFYDGFRG